MNGQQSVANDFGALYPEELIALYKSGERDFSRINILRSELEIIADTRSRKLAPPAYLDERFNALWSDFRHPIDREFEWDAYGHFIPTEFDDMLPHRDLRGADLAEAKFDGSYLYPADLSGASLRRCSMRRVLLLDVNLSDADLSYADLRDSVIYGDLSGANLYMARLDRCKIRGVATGSDFTRSKLRRTRLDGLDLRGATLAKAHFDETDLSYADLRDINFEDVELQSTTVAGVHLEDDQVGPFLKSLGIDVERAAESISD